MSVCPLVRPLRVCRLLAGALLALLLIAQPLRLSAQTSGPAAASTAPSAAGTAPSATGTSNPVASNPAAAAPTVPVAAAAAAPSVARVSKGSGVLPNSQGQIWREYDISPFTLRAKGIEKPERAIVDWVLRETGTEVWFSEPLGILNANASTLRVYHTPEMQRLVASIVDRFVHSGADSFVISVRMATVGSPNWRTRASGWMRPVEVKTPGVDAWLVSRENAALLLAEISRRADYREHNSPNVLIANGQSHTMARQRAKPYVKSLRAREPLGTGVDSILGQIDEGYSLELNPLFSLDGRTVDAVIKCQIDQVEKMNSVPLDLPSLNGQFQRVQIQVPQVVSWRLNERFRWPADQVLVISCGVIASPAPEAAGPLAFVNNLAQSGTGRADALLMLDCQTRAVATAQDDLRTGLNPNASSSGSAPASYRGRY
ncbi:MAG: hypothetical protein ACKOBW_00695 [Planctomycetota bacterium]